jgi:4-hydroxy-2-oxoheptanedioate aldolase
MANKILNCIETSGAALGTVCIFGSSFSIECAAHAGYDFVLVDGQHGEFDRPRMAEAVRALDATDCLAMARPPGHEPHAIEWLLDIGYSTLLVPMVHTALQAQSVVDAAYYPPAGKRSQAGVRAEVRGGPEYRRRSNDDVFLFLMIETVEGLENVEAIARIEGVSGIFIGTADLASSMGVLPGQPMPPEYNDALARILEVTRAAGRIAAQASPNAADARLRIQQGFQLVTIASELRLLSEAHRKIISDTRDSA